jgi:hypothetical protein
LHLSADGEFAFEFRKELVLLVCPCSYALSSFSSSFSSWFQRALKNAIAFLPQTLSHQLPIGGRFKASCCCKTSSYVEDVCPISAQHKTWHDFLDYSHGLWDMGGGWFEIDVYAIL